MKRRRMMEYRFDPRKLSHVILYWVVKGPWSMDDPVEQALFAQMDHIGWKLLQRSRK